MAQTGRADASEPRPMDNPRNATAGSTPANHRSAVYPGYRRGAVIICLGMVASIIVLGLRMPYYNKAASDMVSVYDALLFNSGLPQEFLVYPGLIGRVMLGLWIKGLHAIGFVPVSRLEQLPVTTNLKEYEAVWQQLVQAGRVLSLEVGIVCVMTFIALVRRWLGVWQIAILSGVALAFSSGFALGFRILRPEMMAASLVFSALLLTLISAGDKSNRRFVMLAAAGFLVALAILEKVQSIIPALAILPLALAFGTTGEGKPSSRWEPLVTSALVVVALLALWPAAAILGQGIAQMSEGAGSPYKHLAAGLSGHYQWIVAAGIAGAMIAYAALWRVPVLETVAAIAAVGFGLGCGFDLLYLMASPDAIIAVANPLEHLQGYSAGSGATILSQSAGTMVQTLAAAIGKSLAIHTFVLGPMHRPTLIVEWLAWAGAIIAYRSGRKLLALQIALLIGCAIGEDAIFSLRQVKVYYLPYSDPPIILAGALALTQFKDRLMTPSFERATLALMIFYVLWGHAQPALAVYGKHDRGKVCGIVTLFTKRITIPYCNGAPIPTSRVGFDD